MVICVSRAFCSTDQQGDQKGETARSLASQTEEKKQSDFLEMKCNLAAFCKLNRPRTSKQMQISLIQVFCLAEFTELFFPPFFTLKLHFSEIIYDKFCCSCFESQQSI